MQRWKSMGRIHRRWPLYGALISMLGLIACGADFAFDSDDPSMRPPPAQEDVAGSPDADSDVGMGAEPPGEDREEEERVVLVSPAATENFLFLANRTRGTLVRAQLAGARVRVASSPVGPDPSMVVAWPGRDGALTINAGDGSVSRVRVDGDTAVVDRHRPASGINRWTVDPAGRWAVAWWDGAALEGGRSGAVSEVYLYDLEREELKPWQISTGAWVRAVHFPEETRALVVVTEDGVSTRPLDALTGDAFLPPVGLLLEDESPNDFAIRDALLLSDGETLVVRHQLRPALRVLHAGTGEVRDVEFDVPVTDLAALEGEGSVLVTLRESGELVVLDLFDDAAMPVTLDLGESLGRTLVAADTGRTLSFTTLGEVMETTRVALTDLSTGTVRIVDVRKGVLAGALSPDGRSAILLHRRIALPVQAGLPEQELLARLPAWSIVDMEEGTTKLVATTWDPALVTFDTLGAWAMVLATDGQPGRNELSLLNLETLATRTRSFPLEPGFIGFLPGRSIGFVSEEHPLGRLTFLDLDRDETREVTGFELNAFTE